jgi:hypothetical protein
MTTDEMILALVATGHFTLPDPIGHDADGWFLNVTDTWGVSGKVAGHVIHDLCAAEFARQIRAKDAAGKLTKRDPSDGAIFDMRWALGDGDSPAAIKALWEALQ